MAGVLRSRPMVQPARPQPPTRPAMLSRPLFQVHRSSLVRGNLLVLVSLVASLRMSHFPELRANFWLALPLLGVVLGTVETARCMRRRWSFYHGGVLLCIYMDLMAATIVAFSLVYPYVYLFTGVR